VSFEPVCPEVECALGVPREAMKLIGEPHALRLVTVRSGQDHTDRLLGWARQRVLELEREGLCGFIFKSSSPSSGMERVKVYDQQGLPHKTGTGIFVSVFMEHFPLVSVEDDGRLNDLKLRENFIEAIFTLKRRRDVVAFGMHLGSLVAFHIQHKLPILSHSPSHYRIMGKLVAQVENLALPDLTSRYETLLMAALSLKATLRKRINVLQHMMGYFKKQLTPRTRSRSFWKSSSIMALDRSLSLSP
jgi:uncharacterized protein YbbK (DUF523 family)